MITRSLTTLIDEPDNPHDWTFGKGRQNYLREGDAIAQSVKTRLLSFLGDCFFDTEAGVDWWRLMGGKDRVSLHAQVRSIILNTEGVMRIRSLDTSYNPANRGIQIRYEIDTLFTIAQTGDVEITTLL